MLERSVDEITPELDKIDELTKEISEILDPTDDTKSNSTKYDISTYKYRR